MGHGEATGLGLDVLHFVPSLLGHVLGHQGVGGLDDREFSGHVCLRRNKNKFIPYSKLQPTEA